MRSDSTVGFVAEGPLYMTSGMPAAVLVLEAGPAGASEGPEFSFR